MLTTLRCLGRVLGKCFSSSLNRSHRVLNDAAEKGRKILCQGNLIGTSIAAEFENGSQQDMRYQTSKDSIDWTELTSTTTTSQEPLVRSLQEIVNASTIMHDGLAFHGGVTFGIVIRLRHVRIEERQIGISYKVVRPVITLL